MISISIQSDPTNTNGLRENLLNLSRRSSVNDTSSNRQTPLLQSADESRSNDDGKIIKILFEKISIFQMIPIRIQNDEKLKKLMKHLYEYP